MRYGQHLSAYLVMGGLVLAAQACGTKDPSQSDGTGGQGVASADGLVDGTTDGTIMATGGSGAGPATTGGTAASDGAADGAAAADGAGEASGVETFEDVNELPDASGEPETGLT